MKKLLIGTLVLMSMTAMAADKDLYVTKQFEGTSSSMIRNSEVGCNPTKAIKKAQDKCTGEGYEDCRVLSTSSKMIPTLAGGNDGFFERCSALVEGKKLSAPTEAFRVAVLNK